MYTVHTQDVESGCDYSNVKNTALLSGQVYHPTLDKLTGSLEQHLLH